MKIEQLRDDYLRSKTQIIVLDKQGKIVESDNILFELELQSNIQDFHPFFYIVDSMLLQDNVETIFNGIHIEYKTKKKTIEIIFNSGSIDKNPFLIFIDFTYYYNHFQSIAQEKNESVINFHQTELKNRELQAEKVFKDKFLANVSHDLKTPIWGTNFFVSMLERTELTEVQKEYVTTIKETNNHIYRLVEDLLDISKIESGQMSITTKPFSILELVNHLDKICKPKATEKKLNFSIEINQNITEKLIGDKSRITQILINLIDNAIKFTKTGSIKLKIVQENLNSEIATLSFEVSDTGSGFEVKEKFEVYQSFKKLHTSKKIDGLGLGLSIVSSLVQLMNGTINYETQLNKGTTFIVKLSLEIDSKK